ncbi:sensor domain-containing protein [Metabacillus sp. B2-18]|uniref:sensor domain-containing protein n=1 Tax=Metabacillus sp. B2-18 TaxID=2897333 RepID=UPI001E3885EB|nr:bifunctional diguanylate cyclase/phosphodiesterase [Metabacillus sp. B2-18]UGB28772.1 EAL domain-containing protein [Metabacillus sp. B2-18]
MHRDGHFVLVEGRGVPTISETGEVEHIIFFSRDITEQKNAEKQLKESEERYRKLVEFSPETILIHVDGKIVYVYNAGLKLVGADHISQIIGKNIFDFVSPDYWEYAKKRMQKVQVGISEISEYKILRLDGTQIYGELLGFLTTYQGKDAVQVVVRDVTERKRAEEQVNFLAYYDSLTGIPNRNLLYEYLDEVVANNQEKAQMIAVMFLDLDRFKMINDTYGHSFGDQLLQQVSTRLSECLGEDGRLFRYGGDEYVIVLAYPEPSKVSQIAENLRDTLSTPFFIQERQTFISTSIGISLYPKDGDCVENLIQNADIAMYYAKENGKNNYQYYTNSLNVINNRKMEIEIGIRKAIKNNEFTLYYQPQIDLETKKIIGLEALIRWEHPEYGFISPAEFISVAEETGLIILIGNWVLETACKQCKHWIDIGLTIPSISVNVSSLQFRDKKFVKTVNQILQDTNLDSYYLDLEITESVTHQVEESIQIMQELKALGVQLSIDDFGTGYSSLNYLRHFPIDKLKIDKSFIDEINKHFNGEVIVRTIIELGNSLGFKVIAEGVEYEHQINFLQENNCHLGQGYFFSKPLPTEEIEDLIRKQLF